MSSVDAPKTIASHDFDATQPFVTLDGKLLYLATGDNYPRGVLLNQIIDPELDEEAEDFEFLNRIVYTFKTQHATSEGDYEFWFTAEDGTSYHIIIVFTEV